MTAPVTRSARVSEVPPAESLRLSTPEQYRDAVAEVMRLQEAREGTAEFARRQALRAALHDYERRLQTPECYPGRSC